MAIIRQISTISFEDFQILKQESLSEGFQFLQRLENDWDKEQLQFDRPNEALFTIQKTSSIIGIGGITISPYAPPTSGIARLRRLYIKRAARNQGHGTALLEHIINFSAINFESIELYTKNKRAAAFYESNGFEVVNNQRHITHKMTFTSNYL